MKLEQLKKIIREIAKKEMNLMAVQNTQKSLKLESASRTAMEIGGLTGLNKDAVQKFVDTHKLDIEKVFQFVKKGKLSDRMDFVTAVSGKPNNPIQKKIIKMVGESVNEGLSADIAKHMGSIHKGFVKVENDGTMIYDSPSNAKKASDYLNSKKIAASSDGKYLYIESVNEGVKLSLVDPNTNKFIKTLSLDRTYREAEKEVETLNRRLSPSQKTKGLYWKVTSINESIKAFDERSFGKNGIIIMIDDNGKKVSAIFKNRKNADKYNRNKPEDLKTLVSLANKKGFGKAIDESVNEATNSAKMMAGIKKGSQTGPWTIVVSFNKKVYYQTQVKTKNEIPAKFEHMKKVTNIPGYIITIEDNTGMTVYSEKLLNEAKKYDIGSGYLGNGLTIWNRAEEKDGDYETIAHIGKDGKLTIYDKEIPADIKKMIGIWATSMKKGNRPPSY